MARLEATRPVPPHDVAFSPLQHVDLAPRQDDTERACWEACFARLAAAAGREDALDALERRLELLVRSKGGWWAGL